MAGNGAGYYGHLDVYEQLPSEGKKAYLNALVNDLEAWRLIVGDRQLFDVVEDSLKKIKS